MATSKISVTEGSGKNMASNSITEDAVTKELQRVVLNNSSGTELTAVPVTDNSGSLTVDDGGTTLSIDDGASSLTVDNGGTFAVQDSEKIADNAGFTDGTTKVLPVGFIFDEVAGTALTENDGGAARMDSKRAQVLVIEDETTRGRRATVTAANALKVDASAVAIPVTDNSSTLSVDDGAGSLTVDNGGTFAVQDSQVVADNAGFTDGTTKLFQAGFIFDEVAGTALTENDAAAGRIDSKRAQILVIEDATTRGQRATVTASNALKVDASGVSVPVTVAAAATNIAKAEDVASADADVGVPAMAVRKATPANTSGTDGDYEMLQISAGRLWTSATVDAALPTGTNTIGKVAGNTIVQAASSTITRPADTTAYASGDLIANSTTAGSVNALQFTTLARVSGGSGVIVGAQIQKSTNTVTNVAMRLHLFDTTPTFTSAGDNSAISTVVVASAKGYLGYVDITTFIAFSDVAWGSGAPDNSRGQIPFVASAQTIYGILEARGAFTPGNAEVFTVKLDAYQD